MSDEERTDSDEDEVVDPPPLEPCLKVVPLLEEGEHLLFGLNILTRADQLGKGATLQDAEWLLVHPDSIPTQYNSDLLVFTGTIRDSGTAKTMPVLSRVSGCWKLYWTQLTGIWTPCFKLVVK